MGEVRRWALGLALAGTVIASLACEVPDDGASDQNEATETGGEPALARGITITEIEANQGVRVPVTEGGQWIDLDARARPLLASRDAMLRVHFRVDPEWTARDVEARLTLELEDGATVERAQILTVGGDSDPSELDGAFWFELAADAGEADPGVRFRVELWDLSGDGASLDEGTPFSPVDAAAPVGFEAVDMRIKVVIVPIEYEGHAPEISDELLLDFVDTLYEHNPVVEVVYQLHEPLVFDQNLPGLSAILPALVDLREAEAAEANVYYHAILDVGTASYGGQRGFSNIADDTPGGASERVSVTLLWAGNPAAAVRTFTHETGHGQGLQHVECPNQAPAGSDPEFPHPDGSIGSWGVAVRSVEVHDPSDTFDYMSYCEPSWVSDWTWDKTFDRIATLTSWDEDEQPSPPPGFRVYRGARD